MRQGGLQRTGAGPVGVLLVHTGSPAAPEPRAVGRYLREFLGDGHVLEMNRLARRLLVRLVIVPRRSRPSARAYRRIWTEHGAPLVVMAARVARLLGEELGEEFVVRAAMRYGEPSMARGIAALASAGCGRIVLVTAFPQYATATVGSVWAEAFRCLAGLRPMPAIVTVPPYFDDPGYIGALAGPLRREREAFGPDHVVLSFHGIPEVAAARGDPYPRQCEVTSKLLAGAAGLEAGGWTLAYQSRFGRRPWLRPDTHRLLEELAGRAARVLVACPGFTGDCLETIDEIGTMARERFLRAGGGELRLVPCLNDDPQWIAALAALSRRAAGAPCI